MMQTPLSEREADPKSRLIVKLTHPPHWPPDLYAQTNAHSGIVGRYQFAVNNDCTECDAWIVWGGLPRPETVRCPSNKIYYVTDESHSERRFVGRFLNQFATIVAARQDLHHRRLIKSHDLGAWHIAKTYEQVTAAPPTTKSRRMSVISSNLVWLEGHRRRYEFVLRLIEHFKDRIDVFGRGFNPIKDKSLGLDDYQYSIAIENSVIPDYFTEKVSDCFLTYTVPIYHGCPNLNAYYPEDAFIRIDIREPEKSIETIERVMTNDVYERRFDGLLEARQRYLSKYHVLSAMAAILDRDVDAPAPPTTTTIKPETQMSDKLLKHALKTVYYGVRR